MSRRKRQSLPRIAAAPPDLLHLLGDTVDPIDTPTHADIIAWTPETAAAAPIPVGPALNVLDLRHRRPGPALLHPAANLILADSETAAGAWHLLTPNTPIAILPHPLQEPSPSGRGLGEGPPATPFHLQLHLTPALAETAAAWAGSRNIACTITPPPGPEGPLRNLAGHPPEPRLLQALARGSPLLFAETTPLYARLEQAGAARRITQAADLADLTPDQLALMAEAARAYIRTHHDPGRIAAAFRRTLLGALATHRAQLPHWPERGPSPHVLVISDEALNLVDIRVHLPFAALLRRGAIAGYAILRHRELVFSTTPVTPDLRFGAIWVQRSTDPPVQLLLRALDKPFIYDLDDLLCVSPSYRDPFPAESADIVRALVRDCAVLSCATPRLARSLGASAKTVVTPNLADAVPRAVHGPAGTLVWASSDKPALAGARAEIERAVRDFCLTHRLKLLCIGAKPPETFAGLDLEHIGLLSYDAYRERLRAAAPGILVGPLDTAADADTQAFIDAKSDIKLLEARHAGLVGVFSRAAPYTDSDLAPAILCDNTYAAWLDGLERARQACERPAAPAPFPFHRTTDGLGPLPWATALRRAPTDLSAAELADAIRFVRTQADTLLTTPDLFDEADYLQRHDDVRDAVADGTMPSGYRHYVQSGHREGRAARRLPTPHDAGKFWWSRLLRTVSRLEAETAARDAQLDQLRDRLALRRLLPRPRPAPAPPPSDDLPWHPDAEIPGPCPVCDVPGPHKALLRILDHTIACCGKCGACFYEQRTPYLYENETDAALLLQLYLEQNAGIHQQTSLLFALENVDSVLDIGCGFGFAVDLATQLGWRATGLDPSAMGAAGAAALAADIRPLYLTPEAEIGRFALVIASEVIEHVPDPHPFLATLRTALAPGGALILTTPDAAALQPGLGAARALCIAAPRVHLILFTQQSLTLALQRAGFRHIQVTSQGDSLLAHASDRDLRFRPDAAQAHLAAYRAYLESLLDRAAPATPLWNGAAGRLFALLAPTAELAPLHALFARIAEAWRDRFGIDLPRLRLPPLLPRSTSAATLAATRPLNLPGILLNRARLEARTPGRTPEQVLAFARPAYLHALQTGRILQAANMIDHDLRQTAIQARMLILDSLAELAPELEPELLQALAEPSPGALGEWLDPSQDALAARLAPAFVSAAAAGHVENAARLEPRLRDLDQLSRALAGQPEILLRTLFTLGRHRLQAGSPAAALDAFQRMASEARRHTSTAPSPADDFLRVANEHMELAAARLHQEPPAAMTATP